MAFKLAFGDPEFELVSWLTIAVIGPACAMTVFFLFHQPKAVPPPQSLAGCYAADSGLAMKLAGDRLSINQPGFAPVKFNLDWTKEPPIVLITDPNIGLAGDARGAPRFRSGSNRLYTFYPGHRVAGKVYGVLSPGDREFIVAEGDGMLIFSPADAAACRGI